MQDPEIPTRPPEKPLRDLDGALLPAGAALLSHPAVPGEVREDTPRNRARFEKNGYVWTEAAAAVAWGLTPERLYALAGQTEPARERGEAAVGRVVRGDRAAVDLSADLAERLRRPTPWPELLKLPEGWRGLEQQLVRCVVVPGRGGDVVVAAATPIVYSHEQAPAVAQTPEGLADQIEAVYGGWLDRAKRRRPRRVDWVVLDDAGAVSPARLPDGVRVVGRWEDGRWRVATPAPEDPAEARHIDGLSPITDAQVRDDVRQALEDLAGVELGHLTAGRLAEATGHPERRVEGAFRDLARTGGFKLHFFEDRASADRRMAITWLRADTLTTSTHPRRGTPMNTLIHIFRRLFGLAQANDYQRQLNEFESKQRNVADQQNAMIREFGQLQRQAKQLGAKLDAMGPSDPSRRVVEGQIREAFRQIDDRGPRLDTLNKQMEFINATSEKIRLLVTAMQNNVSDDQMDDLRIDLDEVFDKFDDSLRAFEDLKQTGLQSDLTPPTTDKTPAVQTPEINAAPQQASTLTPEEQQRLAQLRAEQRPNTDEPNDPITES